MSEERPRCARHLGIYHEPCSSCGADLTSIDVEQRAVRHEIALLRARLDWLTGRGPTLPRSAPDRTAGRKILGM